MPTSLSEQSVAKFLRAVGTGDAGTVDRMLAAHPALAIAVGPHPFWGGRPQALHVSIETRRADMFDRLLRAGADVNGTNHEYMYWSPLLLTCTSDQPRMRLTLLRRGARVGLAEALAMGDDDTALRLLEPGLAALPERVPSDASLLAFARTPAAIDRLLDLGVSTTQPDFWGSSPVEALSRLGPKGAPLVRHLVTRGVAVAPEAFARLNDRPTLDRLLAEQPALTRNPRMLKAAVEFGHRRLAKRLLERGADPDGRCGGTADETPLHSAAWNGDLAMVELLLDRGADPRLRDRQYDATPAGWAATAVDVTNNPKCREVAHRLEAAERAGTGTDG